MIYLYAAASLIASFLTGLVVARFISIGQGSDNPSHQDTDSQSAISAGDELSNHFGGVSK